MTDLAQTAFDTAAPTLSRPEGRICFATPLHVAIGAHHGLSLSFLDSLAALLAATPQNA